MSYKVPALTEDQRKAIDNSEVFKQLVAQPGFAVFVAEAQKVVLEQWIGLLSARGEDMVRTQSWIEGANFVLGIANAAIRDGQRVADEYRRAEEGAAEAARASERFQQQRTSRGLRVGASLS